MRSEAKKIGVLALQGGFIEHMKMLEKLGCEVFEVRTVEDTKNLDAIVLPGGESTTLAKMMQRTGLDRWLLETKIPILATCAGLITISKNNLGLLDTVVERNAYGSQMDSFEAKLRLEIRSPKLETQNFDGIFIRAPRISMTGKDVKVLAMHDDAPVLIQQKNILGCTFHPELTKDTRIHELFLKTL